VTDDAGTGIVHQALALGEDDYGVCLKYNIIQKNHLKHIYPVPLMPMRISPQWYHPNRDYISNKPMIR
jgi:hypothetical protein